MIRFVFFTLLFAYVSTYVLAMIDIIGSWIITRRHQGIRWNLNYEILLPAIIPFAAQLEAISNFDLVQQFYKNCKPNDHKYKESFTAYLLHGRLTIDEYYEKQQTMKILSQGERQEF